MPLATFLRDHIIGEIEKIRSEALPEWIEDYALVLADLNTVAACNERGRSYCGMASSMMLERFGKEMPIMAVVAAPENTSYHHFNIVTPDHGEMLVCDLTVSQFMTRPMDLLQDRPYFIGSVGDLKKIISTARDNTWSVIQENFPDKNFRSLWDVDYARWHDQPFLGEMHRALDAAELPCLKTESFYRAWETTWGDSMRVMRAPNSLSPAFFKAVRPVRITAAPSAAIRDMVHWKNYQHLSLKDGPKG